MNAQIIDHPAKKKKPRKKYAHKPAYHDKGEPAEIRPETSIITQAEWALRNRLTSTSNGIKLLDGSPYNLDRLMTEANKVHELWGWDPLGKNPRWRGEEPDSVV